MSLPMTALNLQVLAELADAVYSQGKIHYHSGTGYPSTAVLRYFVSDERGSALLRSDEDLRHAYVWSSGMFEHFIPVPDVVAEIIAGRMSVERG